MTTSFPSIDVSDTAVSVTRDFDASPKCTFFHNESVVAENQGGAADDLRLRLLCNDQFVLLVWVAHAHTCSSGAV